MSVMALDDKIYNQVLDSISQYHGHPYFLPLSMDCENTVKELRKLNYKSYAERYNEKAEAPEFIIKHEKPVSIYQLLKSLQCIRYQIEGKAEKDWHINMLDSWIESIKSGIINQIPEYAGASWG